MGGASRSTREAGTLFERCRRPFIRAVVSSLKSWQVPVRSDGDQTQLCWRGGDGTIGVLRVFRYCGPDHQRPDMPLLIRISATGDRSSTPRYVFDGLGGRSADDARPLDGRLELTVLPEQLRDFAPWFAAWVVLRARPELATPAPPHPLLPCDGDDLRRLRYAWTVAAAEAYRPH